VNESLQKGVIESITGVTLEGKKSKLPAKLDYIQSATGLFLALFMVAHMLLVSSILLGKDVMYTVTKLLEGSFLVEGGHPAFVAVAVAVIFTIFIVHAGLAMRKFPINYKQYKALKSFKDFYNHPDTNLWFIQAITGFVMFFAGSVHLYYMLANPGAIGPYASSDRMVSEMFAPLYLILLIAVEFHGAIGLYRLSVKWGWFDGDNPKENRKKLQTAKKIMSVFFLVLGIATWIAYVKIGIEHKDKAGERYVPQTINVTKGAK
jgi:fumarate reductase subunit C